MSKKLTTTDVRKKLERLGAPVPRFHSVYHLKGDTFAIFAGESDYCHRAAAAIRRAGYWAKVEMIADSAMLLMNFSGTEWEDGFIPENLAGLPLRPAEPTQTSMFDDGDEMTTTQGQRSEI